MRCHGAERAIAHLYSALRQRPIAYRRRQNLDANTVKELQQALNMKRLVYRNVKLSEPTLDEVSRGHR